MAYQAEGIARRSFRGRRREVSVLAAGLTVVDLVHRVEEHPRADQKVTARSREVSAGGPAANAAVAVAALGGRATLVSPVGSTELAGLARADLAAQGVTLLDVAGADFAVNVSAVTVKEDTGTRSVVSLDGGDGGSGTAASAGPDPEAVSRAVESTAPASVLVDGHHPPLAWAAAEHGRRRGVPVVLDAGRWKPHFARLIGAVDEVVCSADFMVPGGEGFDDIVAYCLERGSVVVARTHGPEPIELSVGASRFLVTVPAVTARDTLGAGDVLHGAYALGRAAGLEPQESLAKAAQVAALRCAHVGARAWIDRL